MKNTIPQSMRNAQKDLDTKRLLGMKRAMEVARTEIVNNTNFPVVSSRYKNSLKSATGEESINRVDTTPSKITGEIGTSVPYATRVEFGFVGEDSLGRKYNQKGQYNMTNGLIQSQEKIKLVMENTLNGRA